MGFSGKLHFPLDGYQSITLICTTYQNSSQFQSSLWGECPPSFLVIAALHCPLLFLLPSSFTEDVKAVLNFPCPVIQISNQYHLIACLDCSGKGKEDEKSVVSFFSTFPTSSLIIVHKIVSEKWKHTPHGYPSSQLPAFLLYREQSKSREMVQQVLVLHVANPGSTSSITIFSPG